VRFAFASTCLLALAVAAGCAGPYSGKPETLSRPRQKKRPKNTQAASEVGPGGTVAPVDDPCRTNFFGEPFKGRRKTKEARAMVTEAETALAQAERTPDQRTVLVAQAMSVLSNALSKDPYAPEPTYKLAVAYAMVGRKACTLALLERLKALGGMADVEAEAERTAQRAARDPAFGAFAADAKRAVGQ
jgi:hypothetical protein